MWKKHAIIIAIILIVIQPIFYWLYVTNTMVSLHLTVALITTNYLALIYSIIIVRMAEKTAAPVQKKIKELGIDPPTYENLFAHTYERIKPFLDAIKEENITMDDIKSLLSFIKKLNKPIPKVSEIGKKELKRFKIK